MGFNLSVKVVVILVLSLITFILGIILFFHVLSINNTLTFLPLPHGKLAAKTMPQQSQVGTLFFIKTKLSQKTEQQNLILEVTSDNFTGYLDVYDDGNHQDGLANDSVYGGFFDSTNKPLGRYEIKYDNESIGSFIINFPRCELIKGSLNSNRINFVFVPSGYNDYQDFRSDAIKILTQRDSLLNLEPFFSYRNSFSFSIVNTSTNLDCKIGYQDVPTIIRCNRKKVLEEASSCDVDNIVVLVNNKKQCGSSSSYAKVCAKNSDAELILDHELGHSFGGLADEYDYQEMFGNYNIGEFNSPNCAKTSTCEKWKNISSGCFPGCTYSNYYRSVERNSIMLDLYPRYNAVCSHHIVGLIKNYTKSKQQLEHSMPVKKSYFLDLLYDHGKIKIKDIYLKPVRSSINLKPSKYTLKLFDSSGNILTTNLDVSNIILPIPGTFSKPIIEDYFEFSVLVPYSLAAKKLVIYKNKKPIVHASLVMFQNNCGDGLCSREENHVSCPVDCKLESDSFCEVSECDPDCPSQKNCLRNQQLSKIFVIFLTIGSFILIFWIVFKSIKPPKK